MVFILHFDQHPGSTVGHPGLRVTALILSKNFESHWHIICPQTFSPKSQIAVPLDMWKLYLYLKSLGFLVQLWNMHDRNYFIFVSSPLKLGVHTLLGRTFCYPRFLHKNEQTNSFLVLLGKKPELVRSFFGRIRG